MKLQDIDNNTKDALRIVNSFIDAVAVPTWANEDCLDMAMEYLEYIKSREDPECQSIFREFINYLMKNRNGEL